MKKKALTKHLNRAKAKEPKLTPDQWEKVAIDLAHKLIETLEKAGRNTQHYGLQKRVVDVSIFDEDGLASLMLWHGTKTEFIHQEKEGGRIDYRSL